MLAAFTVGDLLILWLVLALVLAGLAYLAWFNWKLSNKTVDPSPYTGLPLRYGSDIGYYHAERIYKYLQDLHQYDNRIFDLGKAAFCRDTGRIFPNAINWLGCIRVDWNFIQKKRPGHYVSWGSLTGEQQQEIRRLHGSLEGFQTEYSSAESIPRLIEPEYAYSKPGPLYVDVTTNALLGWKIVPGTDFEVLIVQHPLNIIIQKTE